MWAGGGRGFEIDLDPFGLDMLAIPGRKAVHHAALPRQQCAAALSELARPIRPFKPRLAADRRARRSCLDCAKN